MKKSHLVRPSRRKAARLFRSLGPAAAAAFLGLAVVLTERAPEEPAPPEPTVTLARPAPPPALAPASRKVQADYERAVDLYAKGRLRDSVAILERFPDDPSAARALRRIRAELAARSR